MLYSGRALSGLATVMLWFALCSVCLVVVPRLATADGRLPNDTIPLHYDLHLEVTGLGVDDFTYRGNVSVRIAIASDTDQIVLHSVRSTLGSISVRRCRDGVEIPHRLLETDGASELLRIRTARVLRRSDDQVIQLTITFNSTLGEERFGFYRTQYRGPKRVPMAVAATHFQPCYARLAFPCFDEPALKSTFQVTIVSNASHLVVSNAPVKTITWLPDGHKAVLFERTPPMQTYLVSFLIANFTSVHASSPSGVRVGILAPPKDQKKLQFSLQAATSLLTSLEEYTGQRLGLTKLDHAAIPRFGNAMENWGLVAYDEQFLVLSPKAHRLQRAQAVITIGHETAHQLFGNLVGPAWWSYLWLSEGFATYFEMLLGSDLYPELLPLEESFAVRHMRPALLADALEGHALTVEPLPADTAQIEALFDTITYSKAGCILRMINCSIGETAFKSGVRTYLARYRNGTVSPGDLYGSFPAMPDGPTVEQMFRSWADKPGHPVVTVERLNSSFVRFRQQRHQPEAVATRDTDSRWYIPITYYTNSSAGKFEYRPAFWMQESDHELVVRLEMEWQDVLVVNPRQIGFYRVEYDERGWNTIVDILSTLPSVVQAKLVDDAFGLARTGLVGYEVCLEMLQELAAHPDPVPWLTAMAEENVGFLQRVLQSEQFDQFVVGFVGDMFGLAGNLTQSLFQSQALERAFDWWARLAAPAPDSVQKKAESAGGMRRPACPLLTVDNIVEGFVSPDDLVRDRLFARLKCQPKDRHEPLIVALERIKETKLLTPGKLFAVLESLVKSDPGRFLHPTVRFLRTVSTAGIGSDGQRLQHLLSVIVPEVTDRNRAADVRKLIVKNAAALSENFLSHANTVMTSTISWRMQQVPKLREFVTDSRMAAYYGKEAGGRQSSLAGGLMN
ncbi:glutamyl aminopeptidase-like [Anopheles marshallii]|uniref:glutamyl aminopeptidase-like n=1 Tax=Anopheles marshallii TaxID=1521116 RepID=UPI00237C501A|nr:glutamyl aminopeptidase-like [Anopheles marshallii]